MNYLKTINFGSNILKSGSIKSHLIESELLLAKVLNSKRENILINLDKQINFRNFNDFKKLILRRKKREPIAHILKNKEFWKLNFFVNEDVLIPRPSSELIVEEILKLIEFNSSKRILDIGTGSGCLIISIIYERPNCSGNAIDICKKALNIAKYNAKIHHINNKISFFNIDVDKFRLNKYDFIVSNPPYISNFDIKRLDDDVKFFEPHLALKGGLDGFSEIKKLIIRSKKLLKYKGKLIFEIGNKQLKFTTLFLKRHGFYLNKICRDIQTNPRVIIATKLVNE